tara:strand:+ start:34278 stop:35120 length:843 start_codon:yes stop_codon:yes gene_type:complete
MKKIFSVLKNFLYPSWDSSRSFSKLNLLKEFSDFKPHGNQDYKSFEPLVIKNIKHILPKISSLVENLEPTKIDNYLDLYNRNNKNGQLDKMLKFQNEQFVFHGSDKTTVHNYHYIYSYLFPNREDSFNLLEIGLGTNDPKIVSSMGVNGKPGASLRAFKKIYKNANIYGADVDEKILFQEKRIKTMKVDQNNLTSLYSLNNFGVKFNLIIDDGLHYQLSNLNTLIYALDSLDDGGYLVIEDIGDWTLDTWKVVNFILSKNYYSEIVKMSETNYIFILQKK